MQPPEFNGWAALPVDHHDRRWEAVRNERIKPIPGIKTPDGAHRFIRKFMRYQADASDDWSTPSETLKRGYGDCEDLALLERAIRISLGKPSNEIWFVLVRDLVVRVEHAMLVVDGMLIDSRSDIILPVAQASDYAPVMAFCDDRAVLFGRRK